MFFRLGVWSVPSLSLCVTEAGPDSLSACGCPVVLPPLNGCDTLAGNQLVRNMRARSWAPFQFTDWSTSPAANATLLRLQ